MKRLSMLVLLAVWLVTAGTGENAAVPTATLPIGFTLTEVVSGFISPVDIEFLPDGSYLVAEKGQGEFENSTAYVKWVVDDTIQAEPVLTIQTNSYWDSGILGMILDPDFANNQQFYLWYASGVGALGWDGASSMRLSRFTFDPATGTAANETIILDLGIWHHWHLGGGMVFDDAGNLYISVGDAGDVNKVQQLGNFRGKVLRIRPTADGYTVPADNPYTDVAGALPEIYALGFRNPYRMAQSATGEIVIGDVGAGDWEEANVLLPGRNYGWADREGPCPRGQRLPCAAADPKFTDPNVAYVHADVIEEGAPSGAISAVGYYAGTQFPEAYHGRFFFGDLSLGFLSMGDLQTGAITPFGDNVWGMVDLVYHDEAFYFADVARPGRIMRIDYVGIPNVPPELLLRVDKQAGAAPLTVAFAAEAFDADGDALTYVWDFADGTTITGTAAMTHTYTADGTYDATVTVIDEKEATVISSERIAVYSGELPQIDLINMTDPTRTSYHAGDNYQLRAVRSSTADLAPTPWRWRIDLHHNTHVHTLVDGIAADTHTFAIPTDNHDSDWSLWYEFTLTMETNTGQEIAISREIFPAYSDMTFASTQPVLLTINDVEVTAPYTLKAIVGIENHVVAPPEFFDGDAVYRATGWRNTTSMSNTMTVNTPLTDTTYTVMYQFDRPAERLFMPLLIRSD